MTDRRPNRWQTARDPNDARVRTLQPQHHQQTPPRWSLGLLPVLRTMGMVVVVLFAWPYVVRAARWLAFMVFM